jgi:uncharacterized protein YdaU (DUF1376 family)
MAKCKHTFKAPAFQLYAREFANDESVVVMEPAAVGVYILLLCHQWIEGSIPADIAMLARICRTTPDFMRMIWPQVEAKFPPVRRQENRLANPKLEMIRSEKSRFTQKQSESGARGAQKRWTGKRNEINGANGVAHPETIATRLGSACGKDSSGSGSGSVIHSPQPPVGAAGLIPTPVASRARDGVPDSALHEAAVRIRDRHPAPRRCGIGEVVSQLRAILRRHPAAEQVSLLERIEANHASYCSSDQWQREGGIYAKGLDNWLAPTKGRWESPAGAHGRPTKVAVESDLPSFDHGDPRSCDQSAVAS